jgi:hypothetical protein
LFYEGSNELVALSSQWREENQRKTLEARERINNKLNSHDAESGNQT